MQDLKKKGRVIEGRVRPEGDVCESSVGVFEYIILLSNQVYAYLYNQLNNKFVCLQNLLQTYDNT